VPSPKPGEKDGYQILGYDGAGVIEAVGSSAAESFKPGDEVFYAGSPIRQGSNAEFQLVDSRSIARKPQKLDFVQAAAMPLTWITAYEALVERMEIQKGEKAGLLIVNGSGGESFRFVGEDAGGVKEMTADAAKTNDFLFATGVGSVASQIARQVLQLPVVVTTASRPETQEFSTSMGATHTINHREDLVPQLEKLKLDVPIKYIFITHSTTPYIAPSAAICAPFGKVCTIVQSKEVPMYGTEFMAKSLSFIYCLLGTKPWYGVDVESHGKILRELAELLDKGEVQCHLKQKFNLDVAGLRKAHEAIEAGGSIGKNGLSVDFGEGKTAFT